MMRTYTATFKDPDKTIHRDTSKPIHTFRFAWRFSYTKPHISDTVYYKYGFASSYTLARNNVTDTRTKLVRDGYPCNKYEIVPAELTNLVDEHGREMPLHYAVHIKLDDDEPGHSKIVFKTRDSACSYTRMTDREIILVIGPEGVIEPQDGEYR